MITKEFFEKMTISNIWLWIDGFQKQIHEKNESIEILKIENQEQAAEIEKLKFCLAGYMTDIEKLKDSIRAFESEQRDYEKTCVRLREELSLKK